MTHTGWHAHVRTFVIVAMTLCLVLWAPAGALGPAIGSAAAQESGPPQTPASYYGNVTIDGEPAPAGTTVEAVVNGSVEGSITIDEAGQYGGSAALDEKLSVGGEARIENSPEVRFFVDNANIERTEVTTTDPETVEWVAGDVQRVDLRASVGSPLYEVEIIDPPSDVTAGSNADVTLNITNAGAAAGEGTINVSVDGEVRGSTTEDLAPGESTESIVSVPTSVSDGDEITLTADSGDDTASTTVSVERPPELAVGLAVDTPIVNPGEAITGTINVTNVGGQEAAEQNLSVTLGGSVIRTARIGPIGAGESTELTLDYAASADDAGTRTLAAATADDSNATLVTVNESATFAVDIIESESTLDVVAGQNVTVLGEVTNVGGSTGTQTVTVSRDGAVLHTTELTLEPGEIADVTAENETLDGGTFNVTVESEDSSETVPATVADRQPFLEVAIGDSNESVDEPLDGEVTNVTVDATIENLGTESEEQTIEFRVDGNTRVNESITVGSESSESLSGIDVPIYPGETPSVDLTVASADDAATETVDVNETAQFETTIVARSNETSLDTETPFTPTINVTNVGDQAGDGYLRVRFNGSIERNFSIDGLEGGEEIQLLAGEDDFALSASTSGTKVLEAEALNNATGENVTDDVSTRQIDIGDAPNFEIDSFELSGPDGAIAPDGTIDEGETLSIDATIKNTGDLGENQTVTIEFDGTEIEADVLNATASGGTADISASYSVRSSDVGDRTVSVSTDDDTQTQGLTVRENAEFAVSSVDADDEVIAGDSADVTVRVENVGGDADNTGDVRLYADSEEAANQSVTLAAGEERLVQFDGDVTPEEAGTVDVTAVTDDDTGTDTIDVGEPGELALELLSVTDPLTTDDTLRVNVRATNVGDGEATETVALKLDGRIVDSPSATVAGGESGTVELRSDISRTLDNDASEQASIEIDGANDQIDSTITIEDPPTEASFRVSDLRAPSSVLQTDQTVTVTANVTNIGDESGTQDVALVVDGATTDTNGSLALDGGETKEVDLTFDTDAVGVGDDLDFAVESADDSADGTITIEEPTPGTAAIVSTELLSTQAAQNERFEVNATIRNVGDVELNETVTADYLAADSVENSTEIDALAAGAETTVTLGVTPPAEARTVPVDFGSIQSGLAEVDDDGTVEVAPGTYTERDTLEIDAPGVTLTAAEQGSFPTITSPRNADDALVVTGDDARVTNLRFADDGNGTAIELAADNATVRNVRVVNWATGVEETSGTNRIVGSSIVDSGTGIVLAGDGGSAVEFTRIARSATRGIDVQSADNEIRGAGVYASTIGVDIRAVVGTEIRQSTIRGNADVGVRATNIGGTIDDPSAEISYSALESNGVEAFIQNGSVNANSTWWGSSAEPIEGVDYVVRSNLTTGDPLQTRPDSQFAVSASLSGDKVRREQFSVTTTVTNDGTVTDLQTVELLVDGSPVDSTDVELDAGTQTDVTFAYTPDLTDGNSVDLSVRSLDDSVEADGVPVLEPAFFAVQSLNAVPTEVTAGDTITLSPDIENTGEAERTQSVQLLVDGAVVDSTDVTLGGAATETPSLSYATTADDVGELNVTVATDDATRESAVTVLEADDPTEPGPEDPTDPDPDDPTDDSPTGDDDSPIRDIGVGVEPTNVESVVPSVDSDAGQTVATFETTSAVASVALDTTAAVEEVTVSEIDPAAADIEASPGTSLALQDISVPQDVEDTSATIEFQISNDDLESADASAENLRVFRRSGGTWNSLPTQVVDETDSGVVLEAETPGFSLFAVSSVESPQASIELDPTPANVGEQIDLSGAESTDPDGREPLVSSGQGRFARSSIRRRIYHLTACGATGDGCTCDASRASKCSESVSPHDIRRSSISAWLDDGADPSLLSERVDTSPATMERHYDVRSPTAKRELRRDAFDM